MWSYVRRTALLALPFLLTALPVSGQSIRDFFNDEQLQEFSIRMDPADWQTLKEKYLEDTYYRCEVTWRGMVLPNAGIRSRGTGSRTPYKPALRRISQDLCCRPAEAAQILPSSLASQYWMLAGAGAKLDGPGAGLRVAGLASIYAKVFRVWLDDSSPGLDRTMAALDRRLKSGEEWLSRVESTCESLCRFACGFMPRGWTRRDKGDTAAEPAAGAASANPARG